MMRIERSPKENFVRRPLTKARKSRKKIVPLRPRDPVNRVYLYFLVRWAEDRMFDGNFALIDRDFKAAGITAGWLHRNVCRAFPEFSLYYQQRTGTKFRPEIAYNRVHRKKLYTNGPPGKSKPGSSGEYYLVSPMFKGHLQRLEDAYRHYKETDLPLSLLDMVKAGGDGPLSPRFDEEPLPLEENVL